LIIKMNRKEHLTFTQENELYEFLKTVVRANVSPSIAQRYYMTYDELVHDIVAFIYTYLHHYDPSKPLMPFLKTIIESAVKGLREEFEKRRTIIPLSKYRMLSQKVITSLDAEKGPSLDEILETVDLTAYEEMYFRDLINQIISKLRIRDFTSAKIIVERLRGMSWMDISRKYKLHPSVVEKKRVEIIKPAVKEVLEKEEYKLKQEQYEKL